MRTTNPSVVDRRIDMPARPSASPQRAVVRAASLAAGRFAADHWLIDLLALVLAALLIGATALYGLAVVSTWTAAPNAPGADLSTHDGLISTSVASGAWDDLLLPRDPVMGAVGARVRAGVPVVLAGILGCAPAMAAMSAQEAILRAKPATVVIVSRIGAEVSMDCGHGAVSVSPAPFVGTGSGWFVDGRGYVVTSAHVVSPPAAPIELRKAAIQEGCVDPSCAPGAWRAASAQRSRSASAPARAIARRPRCGSTCAPRSPCTSRPA